MGEPFQKASTKFTPRFLQQVLKLFALKGESLSLSNLSAFKLPSLPLAAAAAAAAGRRLNAFPSLGCLPERGLPLSQGGVEGLPVSALHVVVVEVLQRRRRRGLRALLELKGVFLGVGGGGVIAVCEIGIGAGRVKFRSHLLFEAQGQYLIAWCPFAVGPDALFGLL